MVTETRVPDLPEWLRELYPFRTRTVEIGGQNLSFVEEGQADGPTVVLLHGNSSWSFVYRDVIRILSGKYRVLAPDMVGFGLSSKPSNPGYHSLERHSGNFRAFIDEVCPGPITLVANGWGGPIGLSYAGSFPDKISRLVLCNTWAFPLPQIKGLKLPLALRLANSGRIGRLLDSVFNFSMIATIESRTHRKLSDWVIEGYKYPFPDTASRTAIRIFSQMFFKPDETTISKLTEIHSGLKNVQSPVDILWGACDPLLSKLSAYLLRYSFRNSREPVFLPDASHYLPEDSPHKLSEIIMRDQSKAQPGKDRDSVFKILL